MKIVAALKLRAAQEQFSTSRQFASGLEKTWDAPDKR